MSEQLKGTVTIGSTGESFELETQNPGHVPPRVIEELRRCHREAKDYVAAFADATKAQAEKYEVKPGALRRYIVALEADNVDAVEKEIEDLNRLIDEGAVP